MCSWVPPYKRSRAQRPRPPAPDDARAGRAGLEALVRQLAKDVELDTDLPDGHPVELRMTVAQARDLVAQLRGTKDGIVCPVCSRHCIDHTRTAGRPMASLVAWLVERYTGDPIDISPWKRAYPKLAQGGSNYSRAQWWGLAERTPGRAPLWSPTEKGKRWARGSIKIHAQVVVRDNVPIVFDGPEVAIHEVDDTIEPQRGGSTPTIPGLLSSR